MQMKKQNWLRLRRARPCRICGKDHDTSQCVMRSGKLRKAISMVLLPLCLCASVVQAELTATVSPGYTFGANERPDYSKLNRLGLPTITITGTLDGTNAGISAGSINANMFAASVVDNITLDYTNSSPQALRIKAAGVNSREVSTNLAGAGLLGGAGTVFSVNVDAATLRITNDVVTLGTNPPSFIVVASNSVVVGTTNNQGLAMNPLQFATNVFPGLTLVGTPAAVSTVTAAGTYLSQAHNLGVTPKFVRGVLICTTTDNGYAVGDEVPFEAVIAPFASYSIRAMANATNVFAVANAAASTGGWQLANKSTGAGGSITVGSWNMRIDARP